MEGCDLEANDVFRAACMKGVMLISRGIPISTTAIIEVCR